MAAVVALGVLGLPATSYAASSSPAPIAPGVTHSTSLARTYPDRPVTGLIVRTRDGKTPTAGLRRALTRLAGGPVTAGAATSARILGGGMTRLSLTRPLSPAAATQAAHTLAAEPGVLSVTPDSWVYPTATVAAPHDQYFSSQWDLWDGSRTAGGYSVRSLEAWSQTRGSSSIVVAVLDTGLTVHPDLTSSVTSPTSSDANVKGYDFVSADPTGSPTPTYAIANDGNGWDSNPSDPGDGITAADNAGLTANGLFQNCGGDNADGSSYSSWHGTHVAGTIAAHQGNGLGVSGLAPGVKIQPVRVLGKCGGNDSDVVAAIEWASGHHVQGVPDNTTPAKVINMSLGGPGACAPATQAAIADARNAGVTVVVAAGNSSGPSTNSQPADCAGVIAVTASTRSGGLASYSNYGVNVGDVALGAPGGDAAPGGDNILSTVNLGTFAPGAAGYADYAGTSMATPHVAAAVALLQSLHGGTLTPDQVAARLTSTVTPWAADSGCTVVHCGAGILNIGALLVEAPAAPGNLAASAGDGAVHLRWTTPADNGSPLTAIDVSARVNGTSTWLPVASALSPTTTSLSAVEFADHTPFTNGTLYDFRVTATNALGVGAAAVVSAAPTSTPPPSPPAAPVVVGGVEHLTFTWAPDLSGAVPTGYAVRYRKVGATSWTCATGVSATGIAGCDIVPAGTTTVTVTTWPTTMPTGTYEAEVAATDDAGHSVWSVAGRSTLRATLVQAVRLSSTVVLPYLDGYQDSATIRVGTNRPGGDHGFLDVLDSRGRLVRSLTLAPASYWVVAWDGRTASGTRAPDGVYTVTVHLLGRGATTSPIAARPHITVATTQAAKPTLWLGSRLLFPVVDHYRDLLTITAHDSVPSTLTLSVVRGGRTYWHMTTPRATSATVDYDGHTPGGSLLPAGTYTIVVVARAGEGTARVTSTTFTVSRAHAVRVAFSVTGTAAAVLRGLATGTTLPGTYGVSGVTVPESSVVTFAAPLPASVMPPVGVRAVLRSHGAVTGAPIATAGWYSGDPLSPVLGGATPLRSTTTLPVASAAAVATSRARFYVRNAAVTGSGWAVLGYTVSGYRYVLVP